MVIVKGMGDQFFRVDQSFCQPVDDDREFIGVQARGENRQLFAGDALLNNLARLAGEAHQHDARRRRGQGYRFL